jgi:putative N6-adenine-specific DNA methylase
MLRLVATCALGLEEILAGELDSLGHTDLLREPGAVRFLGRWPDVWRANLRLRTANRVLVELGRFPGGSGGELAQGARRLVERDADLDGVALARLLHPNATLALKASSTHSRERDVRWIALKVKDGLVDGQRRRFGRRASVDRGEPDLPLRVFLRDDEATLLVDTSGTSLDRRGYRALTSDAPLREQLAAALVLASGWDGQGPVYDPMCGSGTLLIEAGWYALGWPPGALREGWAFERFPGFDPDALRRILREPLPVPNPDVRLYGVDQNPGAVVAARGNLAAAHLADRADIERGDAFALDPPPGGPGLLVVNPPHGERLGAEAGDWKRLGDLLKQRFAGWRAAILAGGGDLGKSLGLRPKRRFPIKNGALDAKILIVDLF